MHVIIYYIISYHVISYDGSIFCRKNRVFSAALSSSLTGLITYINEEVLAEDIFNLTLISLREVCPPVALLLKLWVIAELDAAGGY